jgi:ribosomal-protein-serine acetyltransferase
MFRLDIRDGVYLALLEERHAPAIFTAVNRDRAHLRKWLPWVDLTRAADDTHLERERIRRDDRHP